MVCLMVYLLGYKGICGGSPGNRLNVPDSLEGMILRGRSFSIFAFYSLEFLRLFTLDFAILYLDIFMGFQDGETNQ